MQNQLSPSDAFAAVDSSGRYNAKLAELRRHQVSGVYGIFDAKSGRALYVGESHSGRLYDTITRHFRAWKVSPVRDRQGRRFGGTMYDRRRVKVCYLVTKPGDAEQVQFDEIQRLEPEDNVNDGASRRELPV